MKYAARPDRRELKRAAVNGVVVNSAAQATKVGLQFAYQVLLARLLSPNDFGAAIAVDRRLLQ